jgi:hypothetical protein
MTHSHLFFRNLMRLRPYASAHHFKDKRPSCLLSFFTLLKAFRLIPEFSLSTNVSSRFDKEDGSRSTPSTPSPPSTSFRSPEGKHPYSTLPSSTRSLLLYFHLQVKESAIDNITPHTLILTYALRMSVFFWPVRGRSLTVLAW